MIKLQQITEFLISLNLVAVEQIDNRVENLQIIPSGKSRGVGGIILYRQQYDAVISIERFPHKTHPTKLLFAQVCAWLIEHDGARDDIAQPKTDIDILDDETADVEITISFAEEVEAIEDQSGPIPLGGVHYRLADAVIDYAKTGDVTT